jgi:hypothetical protein
MNGECLRWVGNGGSGHLRPEGSIFLGNREKAIRFRAELAYIFHCSQFDSSLKDVLSGEAS